MKSNQIFSTMLASLLLLAPEISHAAAGTTLTIGKTASTSTAIVGQMISFQVVVTNLGPFAASSATVSDVLPSGLQYVSSTGPGTYEPSNGSWDLVPGKIGAISILTIQVEATNAGVWLNTASIISSTPPDLNSMNSASASVTVSAAPPIVLTCSSNLTITASTPNGTNVYFTASAYGGCSSPLNLSSVPPSGSTFPIGQTIVTTMASDNCGDTTNCSFTVTISNPVKFTTITSIQGGIKLNWLTNLGFLLQQNDSLGTTNWTPVTNTPTIINGQNQLILSPTNVRGFYRLVNP